MTGSKFAEAEDGFRSSLQDVITVCEKLSPLCKNVDELVGMMELALNNDAQLRLLMKEIAAAQKR